LPGWITDLSKVRSVEIQDAGGKTILRGSFQTEEDDEDQMEREATLESGTELSKAEGDAEIEIERQNGAVIEQELKLDFDGLPPKSRFTVFLDGRETVSFRADEKGDADLQLTRGSPGQKEAAPGLR
jgi:hypothetical protein